MKTAITFEVDTDNLAHHTDEYVSQLWHIGQANPAPYGDASACTFAECVGREIVRRWLADVGPALWGHKGTHAVQSIATGHKVQP